MNLAERILVADIGGTNARFAVAERRGDHVSLIGKRAMEAHEHVNLAEAAQSFLSEMTTAPARAVFAVAAPVTSDAIAFTNSLWRFSIRELTTRLRLKSLKVVNDFAAMARGAIVAKKENLGIIKPGNKASDAPTAVLGPGTGLGLGLVVELHGQIDIVPTQGGFAAFAPQCAAEVEILRFLQREHTFVSFEHVLSGRGLSNLYRAFCAMEGLPTEHLSPEAVTAAALAGGNAVAAATTETFCRILATFAADAVLMSGARGGVILAGGILPKIEAILKSSQFVERFVSRDAMSDYMTPIPVSLLHSDDAALIGASLLAD